MTKAFLKTGLTHIHREAARPRRKQLVPSSNVETVAQVQPGTLQTWLLIEVTSKYVVFPFLSFPSLPFPSLPFPSLPFPSLPFPSLPFPSLPFPSLPFPSLPFPSLPFPSLPFSPFPEPAFQVQADSGAKSGSVRRTSGRTTSKGTGGGGGGAGQGAPPALSTRSRKSTASADLSKVMLFWIVIYALFNPKRSV